MNKGFRFRVAYRLKDGGPTGLRQVEFRYPTMAQAKANYKAILLDFYRCRASKKYEICLNRTVDACWQNPIFYDSE